MDWMLMGAWPPISRPPTKTDRLIDIGYTLCALLEQAQESANPGINATITDRYFDSACATPSLAFPTLLKLNRHHLAKDDSWGRRYERQIGELLTKLEAEDDPYPARLTLEEQGLFILGYYHQKQARYTKKTDSEKEN